MTTFTKEEKREMAWKALALIAKIILVILLFPLALVYYTLKASMK